jgi:signal transduction histidine kinase
MLRVSAKCTGLSLILCVLVPGLMGTTKALGQNSAPAPATITNLHQLTQSLVFEPRRIRSIRLELTVCAASQPKVGVLAVQDDTGVELLEMGQLGREVAPGDRVLIQASNCLLRKRELGIEISASPVVDNDPLNPQRMSSGTIMLRAGWNPIRVEWFNCIGGLNLDVSCSLPDQTPQVLSAFNLCHDAVDPSTGRTNQFPGLEASCYEGYWETVPNFELLRPVKSGVVSNFDAGFRTRDEMVAIRFGGYFHAPSDGAYTFRLVSDDGGRLFLGTGELSLMRLGVTNPPVGEPWFFSDRSDDSGNGRWVTVEGRVSFVSVKGEGMAFDLHSGQDVIPVRLADASGLELSALLNSRIRVAGVGRGSLSLDKRLVLGKLSVASAKDIVVLETAVVGSDRVVPITSAEQVQGLKPGEAMRALPVRIRGVVTDVRHSELDHWISIQDDTRGVLVQLETMSNAPPSVGEMWEVSGNTGAGGFAPVIIADKMAYLGEGLMPEPVRPTWRELANGSRDVQWAELQGLVTDVSSNNLTLALAEGRLNVAMDRYCEADLKPFLGMIVRIRGVLNAIWNKETREVRVGRVLVRNATIGLDALLPRDPFELPLKTPRELFLFDPQASDFQRVKVRGQVVYADARRVFIMHEAIGMRILPVETPDLRAGDLIEAVGYPDISGPSPLLREALVRKTGAGKLPSPREIAADQILGWGLDSTRVRVTSKLVGMHMELSDLVLEMQMDNRLFFARLRAAENHRSLQVGSRLTLTGVYVTQAATRKLEAGSFEVLMTSAADIAVVSKPSWTLQRLLMIVGALLVVLLLAGGWIALLRRQVGQRTRQLQHETRERERAERQRAIEAERTRIARDLHDDLGSSLTEIGVLASAGQRSSHEADFHSLLPAIAAKSRGLIAALDAIVWAVDPEDNSLQSLADYLSGFAEEFLSQSGIPCRFKVPITFPTVMLDGRVRHSVLMAVKESLNNIVRHAKAAEVEFRMNVVGEALEIVIVDNGKGFENGASREGHGLKNLQARLSRFGGNCQVESVPGHGTTVTMRLPLSIASVEAGEAQADLNKTFG